MDKNDGSQSNVEMADMYPKSCDVPAKQKIIKKK